MRPRIRAGLMAALMLGTMAFLAGASLLIADSGEPPPVTGPVSDEAAQGAASTSPLPDFQPTERLPAGSAVAFPTDI